MRGKSPNSEEEGDSLLGGVRGGLGAFCTWLSKNITRENERRENERKGYLEWQLV